MTQQQKTDKNLTGDEHIAHAMMVFVGHQQGKYGGTLEQNFFATACSLAHIIYTKDEAAMQEFREDIETAKEANQLGYNEEILLDREIREEIAHA